MLRTRLYGWTSAVLVVLAMTAGSAYGRVPPGFVGMMADGPVFARGVSLDATLTKMVSSGVQHLRVAFFWSGAQPYARWSDVPHDQASHFVSGPGGVPTAFGNTDAVVAQAAKHHLSLLPVVTYAPGWDAAPTGSGRQPAHDRSYGLYLTALVKRYGPTGTFWKTHPGVPRVPVTSWQVWNEPELSQNWSSTPFAPSYVALLRVAHGAIKAADPHARVILGALTNYGWNDLASIYGVHGSGKLFDVVAANPYTKQPSGVITILRNYRKVMARNGDARKPLLATEVGWPAATGKTDVNYGFNVTERGQAKKLSQLLPLLARNRGPLKLAGFYYYTWATQDPPNAKPFQYAGLLHYDPSSNTFHPKPAFWAFRRGVAKLEH